MQSSSDDSEPPEKIAFELTFRFDDEGPTLRELAALLANYTKITKRENRDAIRSVIERFGGV